MATLLVEQGSACPQCGSSEPWGENSWCPDCGFYPKFSSEPPKAKAVKTPGPAAPAPESSGKLPKWAYPMLIGVGVIILGNIALRVLLYLNGGPRSLIAMLELLSGLGVAFGATIIAWKEARKRDKRVTLLDCVTSPLSVWQPTVDDLPATHKRVWSLAWGLTMALCSVVVIGGLRLAALYEDDWGFEAPKKVVVEGPSTDKALKVLKDQVVEYEENKKAGKAPEPPTARVLIYGYLSDNGSELGRILIALKRGGRFKHCGLLKGKDLSEEDYRILLRRVRAYPAEESAVWSVLNANWVQPIVFAEVTYKDVMDSGHLVEPSVEKLIAPRLPEDDESEEGEPGEGKTEEGELQNVEPTDGQTALDETADDPSKSGETAEKPTITP